MLKKEKHLNIRHLYPDYRQEFWYGVEHFTQNILFVILYLFLICDT